MTDFNGFKGAAVRLDDIDIPRIASEIGCGEDEVHAFMEAETRGSGFDPQRRPRILFERHKFYLYCPKGKLATAVKAGLANKSAGGYGKEAEQYSKLQRAMAIDEHSALLSCSWGLAQVMGFNHKLAGYDSVEEMIIDFMKDEETHLQAAVTFIKNSGLDDELRRHDWKGFAKGYNGSGYERNKYDAKLAAAFAKWQNIRDTPYQVSTATSSKTIARTDSTTVRVVQERLKELGYTEVGNPDGKMGKLTKTGILAFRNENDLPVSDVIDDALLHALDGASPRSLPRNDAEPAAVRQAVPEVQSNFLTKVGAGTLAGTLATGSVTDLASKAEGVRSFISPWKEMFSDIPSWAWLGCGALVLVAIMMIARRGELKGIEAFQAGERR
jgi:hypothetical protein